MGTIFGKTEQQNSSRFRGPLIQVLRNTKGLKFNFKQFFSSSDTASWKAKCGIALLRENTQTRLKELEERMWVGCGQIRNWHYFPVHSLSPSLSHFQWQWPVDGVNPWNVVVTVLKLFSTCPPTVINIHKNLDDVGHNMGMNRKAACKRPGCGIREEDPKFPSYRSLFASTFPNAPHKQPSTLRNPSHIQFKAWQQRGLKSHIGKEGSWERKEAKMRARERSATQSFGIIATTGIHSTFEQQAERGPRRCVPGLGSSVRMLHGIIVPLLSPPI
ncbi:hypothetical protein LENED_005165 [Lentinula edodes]|uniref:Uncharacterized protein n=1 Tax=Lentinula edodes TaxID=5353 RepID=A0A1Q3E8L9_LENED|nr:hypothetical protein LENED_005165 [Lentinula edodes]